MVLVGLIWAEKSISVHVKKNLSYYIHFHKRPYKLEHLEILEKRFSNNTEKMALETGIPRRTLRNWVVEFSKLRTFAGSPHEYNREAAQETHDFL